MKKILVFLIAIIIGNSLVATESLNYPDSVKIGEFRFGGIVFKVDPSGQHGLVCSKSDQAKGIHWNDDKSKITGAKTPDNGVNEKKQSSISPQMTNDNHSEIAAIEICRVYSVTEDGVLYNDWYLPSKEELYLIYLNKTIIDSSALFNKGSFFSGNNEISPTEYCNSPSWDQVFNYGFQDYEYKNSLFNVRAIRKF